MIIGITGGTGFVGSHLTDILLAKGHKVIVFTRSRKAAGSKNVKYAHWAPEQKQCDIEALKQLDAIVHLAGTNVNRRWTAKAKADITKSRVNSTRFLVSLLKQEAPSCKTFIAASAIGYYGANNGTEPFNEPSPPANDFLSTTCHLWEQESLAAADTIRTVIFRLGIVLGKEAGAFPQLAMPVSFGVMPVLGKGSQIMSWVHVSDVATMLLHSIDNSEMKGIYNAVAPNPISQKDMMKAIVKAKRKWAIPLPVPAFALKLLFGEMSTEVLKSCTVSAEKIQATGFVFQYPDIDSAVQQIIKT